ncbi:GspH/FimT family protein [Simiduia curdlanivorans]|uniref:Type II secretion system protein H n=1 Tax=Simiduia curdlanivorans TaxID=1492769 RepID=A0ABV8V9L6_9GAMM|nr:GspH/FimT family protein [Simiduia curdlanivorans]MDN3638540.1 GspH/FimT family protein [Simiduia curdlanivorans]
MKQGVCLGFTLLELIISISIIVIISSIGVPAFQHLVEQNKAITTTDLLTRTIILARTQAIMLGQTTTLCPRENDSSCGDNWQEGINIFIDQNINGYLDEGETLVYATQAFEPGSQIKWKAFGNKNYLSFSPRGFTLHQNGSFYYCPKSKDAHYGRVLILNKAGRARQGLDLNNNGIPETSSGVDISC